MRYNVRHSIVRVAVRMAWLIAAMMVVVNVGAQTGDAPVSEEGKGELEQVLRKSHADYDQLLSSYYMRLYMQQQALPRSGAKSVWSELELPDLSDSLLKQRLDALPTVIPMSYNPVVKDYIRMYLRLMRGRIDVFLSLAEFYFPLFEEVLDRYGLPEELKYLTVVESALNPMATSRAGAAGLWQFMYRTGKMYGLEVNSLVDERRDPAKSTDAAARYLKDLYAVYEDWHLALAAYNCGPGNVNRAIARSGGQNNFWQIYNYLPKETRGYIPAFIAATYVLNYYADHGVESHRIDIPLRTDTVHLRADAFYCFIEKYVGINVEELRTLNPHYRTDMVPASAGWRKVIVPAHSVMRLIELEDSVCKATADSLSVRPAAPPTPVRESRTHVVKKGETLVSIAKKYKVSVANLKRWNSKKSNSVRVGEKLIIYSRTTASTSSSKPKAATTPAKASTTQKHVVKKGETLSSIARRYNTTPAELRKKNNLRSDAIKVGQTLVVSK